MSEREAAGSHAAPGEGAKKAGYTPVIEIGNTVIRLVPEAPAVRPRAPEHVDEDGEIVDL